MRSAAAPLGWRAAELTALIAREATNTFVAKLMEIAGV